MKNVTQPHKPKFIGILMGPHMIEALEANRKFETRRRMAPQPAAPFNQSRDTNVEDYNGVLIKNPYGQKGDILWVRETFYAYGTIL